MPHAVEAEQPRPSARTPKGKASSRREIQQLYNIYDDTKSLYLESNLSASIARLIGPKNIPTITKIVSLGLGSLKSVDQPRRIKQLTILLAIAEQARHYNKAIEIYAQDPSFSKVDEAFLQSLGVQVLSTPSATELGEAEQYIDDSTLVYSPFLTLEAYRLLFSTKNLKFFIGDDFDALRMKWPKHSAGQVEAESLSKQVAKTFWKRAIGGDDEFWEKEDKPFPMAMYWSASQRSRGKQPKAML